MKHDISVSGQAGKSAAPTFLWLGSFWTTLYTDKAFIYAYCKGNGLAAAQLYLNFLEAVNSLSRQNIPIFHREVWLPLIIRLSQQNSGDKIAVGLDPAVYVGPQPEDTVYQAKKVYPVGGNVVRSGFTVYPIISERPVVDGVSRIASAIVSTEAVLLKGTHYFVQGGEIIFREDSDPFANPAFLRREIHDETTGVADEEILLWATDALVDLELIYNNYGYQLAFNPGSSEYGHDAVNALWDVRFKGANLTAVRRAMGALLDVPTTGVEQETVEDVVANADGSQTVITDTDVYTVAAAETIREEVVQGAVLEAGSFLSHTIHYYTKLDPARFEAGNRLPLSQFLLDMPMLQLPVGIAGNGVRNGLDAEWKATDITYNGDDANGNPKLSFKLGGAPADLVIFWQSIWDRAEDREESLADFFADFLWSTPPYLQIGIAVGSLNPMRFFMENFFKYNVGVAVVDFNALPEYVTSLSVFACLHRLLPAHAVLMTVAKQQVSDAVGFAVGEVLDANYGKALSDAVPTVSEAGLQHRWVPRP